MKKLLFILMTIFMMSCTKTEVPEPIKYTSQSIQDTCVMPSSILEKSDTLNFVLTAVTWKDYKIHYITVDSTTYKNTKIGDNWCL